MDIPTISDFTAVPLPHQTKVVLLDFDNTCYEYAPCHQQAMASVAKALTRHFENEDDFHACYHAAQKKVKAQIPTHGASHSRILYFLRLLEEVGAKNLITKAADLEVLYWQTFMKAMRPSAGLIQFLAQCRQNDTKVVVVSDLTTSIQCQKLTALGVASYLSTMVTSEEAGAEKPDPAPFLLALAKTDCRAAEAVMIGDSLEKDIAGARALGIPAIIFSHAEHAEISSLTSPRPSRDI